LRGISTIWSLSPLQWWSQERHRSKGGEQHTQDSNTQHNHAHKWESEHTNTAEEFTTRIVLKSQEQWPDCVKEESRCLRMFLVSLVFSFMRLGIPFIAPRQLGAVGGQLGRPNLPSVGWYTGQSGAPPDSYSRCPVRDLLPYLAHPTIGPQGRLVHRTLSGAHRTVRCAQPTVAAGHVSPADCAADRWRWRPLAHRTVRWIIVVHQCVFSRAGGSPPASLAHRTVRCAWPELELAAHSQLFSFSFLLLLSLFLALRQTH
jgi:hypothetical protein